MNFTRTTGYAFNVLSYMAKNENVTMSARLLHKKLKIPYSYLRTLLGDLLNRGIISSTRGRNGGFRLSKDKSAIYLSEIIEITEGMESLGKCIMGFSDCPFNHECILHPLWTKMRGDILKVLNNTSLADI